MLKEDKNEKRLERHSTTQEDFTPPAIVEDMLAKLPQEAFTDFSKTMLDNSCGIGNFLVRILEKRLDYCKDVDDAISAIKTLYGVELMADNVEECRQRLYDLIVQKFPEITNDYKKNYYLRALIRNRIQWHDSLKFDYKHWKPLNHTTPCEKHETVSFHENKEKDDEKYPMWHETKPVQMNLF